MIICLKCISEERSLFNVTVKIINASLKFLIKVPTQKAKVYKNLYINQISQTNFRSFLNQARILKHIFMLSILFKSQLIRHSCTRSAFKDTQRALEHLKHWESTCKLGQSSTCRALGLLEGNSGTRRLLGQ